MSNKLNYEFKLIKHLGVADIEKVRDLLGRIIFEKCMIDEALFRRAMAFVKREYHVNKRAFCPEAVFTIKEQRAYI